MTERRREDRRVRRSRKLIVQAFERLLGERPYAQITVSAIAREADIDRKTFYQHFGSIDGLLAALADVLAEQVLDQVAAELGEAGAAPDGERALHVFFRALAEHFEQGAARDRRYAERIPFDVLYGHLTRAFERQIVRRGLLDEVVGPGERDASLAFILGGLFSLFRSWLLAERPCSAEEVAAIACTLTERGLAGMAARGPAAGRNRSAGRL